MICEIHIHIEFGDKNCFSFSICNLFSIPMLHKSLQSSMMSGNGYNTWVCYVCLILLLAPMPYTSFVYCLHAMSEEPHFGHPLAEPCWTHSVGQHTFLICSLFTCIPVLIGLRFRKWNENCVLLWIYEPLSYNLIYIQSYFQIQRIVYGLMCVGIVSPALTLSIYRLPAW